MGPVVGLCTPAPASRQCQRRCRPLRSSRHLVGAATIFSMSAAQAIVTIAAAFVGGAAGAILGPAVTAYFRRGERLAARRDEPYGNILKEAADITLVTTALRPPIGERDPDLGDWLEAFASYIGAMRALELVGSNEMRGLSWEFFRAVGAYAEAVNEERDATADDHRERAAAQAEAAVTLLTDAYEALLRQAQRETRK